MVVKAGFPTFNLYWPTQGPRVLEAFRVDFNIGGVALQTFDLLIEEEAGILEGVQSVHVDNFANAAALTLETLSGPQVRYTIPLGKQAILPVYVSGPLRFRVSTTLAAGLIVPIYWTNFATPAIVF